jgi:uncharacterized membrane protein (DUF2068 family)
VTYSPDEEHLRDRLHVATPVGEAWRCLRCGDYTVGAPGGSGPAERGPVMVRGAVLRELVGVRLLAVERAVRGLVLLAAAYGVWRVQDVGTSLSRVLTEDLPTFAPVATPVGDLFAGSAAVTTLADAAPGSVSWAGALLVAAAGLRFAEGAGLWFRRRWAAYVATVVGALGVLLEGYALSAGVRWGAVVALIAGLGVVGYLLYSQRLFGLRGGWRAIVRARRVEAMLEVVRAAGA